MSSLVLKIKNVSKQYRLGELGTGTFSHDLKRWWYKFKGKEDPYLTIGIQNDRTKKGGEYVWALKDINFEVNNGEVLGIIGRNGAGKSTLLKVLAEITSPSKGDILIKGKIAALLEIGTGFHPELTGRENIYLNGAILGMTKSEVDENFNQIVNFSGCQKYIDTPVKRYSSGMLVRLGFSVAAHLSTDILIVDEVLAVGDLEFQKKCIGKIQDVSKNGRTVLFVSHNMASISNLCSRCLVIDNGNVIFNGDVDKAIDHYYKNINTEIQRVQLNDRKDRKGIGQVKFKSLEIINSDDSSINCGDCLRIRAKIKNFTDNNIRIYPSIIIHDSKGLRLLALSALLLNKSFDIEGMSEKEIIWEWNKCFLTPDDYYCDLYMVGGEMNRDIQDQVQHGFYFKVNSGDFFKTGIVNENLDKVCAEFSIN